MRLVTTSSEVQSGWTVNDIGFLGIVPWKKVSYDSSPENLGGFGSTVGISQATVVGRRLGMHFRLRIKQHNLWWLSTMHCQVQVRNSPALIHEKSRLFHIAGLVHSLNISNYLLTFLVLVISRQPPPFYLKSMTYIDLEYDSDRAPNIPTAVIDFLYFGNTPTTSGSTKTIEPTI
jgi:hypothetical protein